MFLNAANYQLIYEKPFYFTNYQLISTALEAIFLLLALKLALYFQRFTMLFLCFMSLILFVLKFNIILMNDLIFKVIKKRPKYREKAKKIFNLQIYIKDLIVLLKLIDNPNLHLYISKLQNINIKSFRKRTSNNEK